MLRITGTVTNYNEFTPPPSQQYPNPQPIRTLEVDGLAVTLPKGFMAVPPVIGKEISLSVQAKYDTFHDGQKNRKALRLQVIPLA